MKPLAVAAAALVALAAGTAQPRAADGPTAADVRAVAPALEAYTQGTLLGDVWRRPGLSPRDRSVVTLAVLIAKQGTAEMAGQMRSALDNGVTPAEISETITHLAFYSGWPNAMAAVAVAKDVFAERRVAANALPPVGGTRLPLDQAAEDRRATSVQENFGGVAPGVVQFTTNPIFLDLWQRPGLAPRDRSLVTVSALVASGQAAQVGFHLHRAMDNGLTREQAAEMLVQTAFYGGWPNTFSAMPVFGDVFAARAR